MRVSKLPCEKIMMHAFLKPDIHKEGKIMHTCALPIKNGNTF